MTASKVVRISSLRQKRASLEDFSNCHYKVATPGASIHLSRGFAPRTPPTRALARRFAGSLRLGQTKIGNSHLQNGERARCACSRRVCIFLRELTVQHEEEAV